MDGAPLRLPLAAGEPATLMLGTGFVFLARPSHGMLVFSLAAAGTLAVAWALPRLVPRASS